MNPKSTSILVLALAAGLISGCAAVSLSSLKSDMRDRALEKEKLVEQQNVSARSGPGATGAVVSFAQVDADLMAISEEAEALAEAPGTSQRAAIGAWRVAVHAAWLALPVEADSMDAKPAARALALADKGIAACDAVDTEKSFTNPRDCALIRFTPAQIAFQVFWEKNKRLERQPSPQVPEYFGEVSKFYREYQTAVWDKAWELGALAKQYPGLDESVTEYIEDEKFIYMCAALIRLPGPISVIPESGAEPEKQRAVQAYQSLRKALADRLGLSEDQLMSQETRSCTTRLEVLGMGS